jgi:hypothetical protein
MGWGNKAIEIRAAETGHLDGVSSVNVKSKTLISRRKKICVVHINRLIEGMGSNYI